MSLREAFLKALDDNEDDTTTRLVYADWLEEQGEHEEADRQRKWPAAKEWLVRLCEETIRFEPVITYADLIERGRGAVKESDGSWLAIDCGRDEDMCDALRAHSREFWNNWSIVTGIPLPPEMIEIATFHCSC